MPEDTVEEEQDIDWQQVAADRLIWIRIFERGFNAIDAALTSLRGDVAEVSQLMQARAAEELPSVEDEAAE